MLKLPRQSDLADLPFARLITAAYLILLPLVIPVGFIVLGYTLASQLKSLRAAVDPCEKIYWRLSAGGCLLIAYVAVALALLMVDGVRGEPWKVAEWWPSLTANWYAAHERIVAVLADLLALLAAGFGLICLAGCFGDVDENDAWCEPDWLVRQYRMEELCSDHEAWLEADHSAGKRYKRESRYFK